MASDCRRWADVSIPYPSATSAGCATSWHVVDRDANPPPRDTVIAPVAPGIVEPASIASWELLQEGIPVALEPRYCTVALDGERSLTLTPDDSAEIVLARNGPPVVLVQRTLRRAAQLGLFQPALMLFGWELAVILAALLLGSFVFSAVGFGMALAMAPILLLILAPRQVVVLSNAMIVVATVLILLQNVACV